VCSPVQLRKSTRRSAFDSDVVKQFLFMVAIGLSVVASVSADDNVREVQTKLSDEGFYFGEIDGAYSSDLSAALSRYQIRNGLPITGQLDAETSKALGAKPAVGPSTAATEQSSETWRRLRKRERRTSTKARETSSPTDNETPATGTETPPQSTPAAKARTSSVITEPASAPPATAVDTGSAAPAFSTERVRDYVAAFVLAGLDKNVGAETEFFADRVHYYDQGVMDREKIRDDLKRYDERWPDRHFWVAGKINVEPQSENGVRVTFPLGFKLRNGNNQSSGKVDKTLVLEPAGDDLEIVAVNERKAD
jgi:peptidoglycan hydrolase-like protein with peptidoglycan-binding domain